MKFLFVLLSLAVMNQSFATEPSSTLDDESTTISWITVNNKGDRGYCPDYKGESDSRIRFNTIKEVAKGESLCNASVSLYEFGKTVHGVLESIPVLSALTANPFDLYALRYQDWDTVRNNWLGTYLGTVVSDGIVGPIKAAHSLVKTGKLPKDFVYLKNTKNMYRNTKAVAKMTDEDLVNPDGPCMRARIAIMCANKELTKRAESRSRRTASVNNGSRSRSAKEFSQPMIVRRSSTVRAQ